MTKSMDFVLLFEVKDIEAGIFIVSNHTLKTV